MYFHALDHLVECVRTFFLIQFRMFSFDTALAGKSSCGRRGHSGSFSGIDLDLRKRKENCLLCAAGAAEFFHVPDVRHGCDHWHSYGRVFGAYLWNCKEKLENFCKHVVHVYTKCDILSDSFITVRICRGAGW